MKGSPGGERVTRGVGHPFTCFVARPPLAPLRYGKVAADLTPTDDFFSDKDSQSVQVFFHATHSKTIPIRLI